MLFFSLVIPIALIGLILILFYRLGWHGIIIILVILCFVPLQFFVGKANGNILKKINISKDKRVKLST